MSWWAGPLDVGRLATDAVADAAHAVAELARVRGRPTAVGSDAALVAGSFAAIDHLRIGGRPAAGLAPYSGFAKAADGWVRLHGNYAHHAAAIERALGVADRAELDAAVASLPAQEVEDAVTAAGGIATAVRTEVEWAAHAHGRATADDPWLDIEVGAVRRPLPATDDLPLAGVRVLDLTRVIAGPSCTQVFACLGADVLRLDPPGRPELLDHYLSNGMGKRSAEVDLAAGLDAVRRELLPQADVAVVGYRPGSLARFGLDPEALRADRPGLVVGSLSAWGVHGPWCDRPGFDSIVQAATGIGVLYGADGRPGALPVQALDHATGYRLAAALVGQLRTGRGAVVRASLLGAARTLLAHPRSEQHEGRPLPVPTGSVASPYGELTVTPLPFTVDGRQVTRPVSGYGAAGMNWLPLEMERV